MRDDYGIACCKPIVERAEAGNRGEASYGEHVLYPDDDAFEDALG
jgi:hypothetical protein